MSRGVVFLHSALFVSVAFGAGVTGTDPGLVELPIAAAVAPTYLDGQWIATTGGNNVHALTPAAPSPSPCDFIHGRNYNHGAPGESTNATSPGDCCAKCQAKSGCVAGVLADATCWFKTADDLLKPTSAAASVVACVQKSAEPYPAPAPTPLPPPVTLTIPSTVPGDLITDLQRANVTGDPWMELNWIDNSHLWTGNNGAWTVSRNFSISSAAAANSTFLLVFDGVKMGAHISLNGIRLGNTTNQFVRYVFPVSAADLTFGATASNFLEVQFDDNIPLEGRWMACSGGWDWAPYSYTYRNDSYAGRTQIFSKGIWKSVYITEVPAGTAVITHVTPHTHYLGKYPTTALVDGQHDGFSVNVTVHLWAPDGGSTGELSVSGLWGSGPGTKARANLNIPSGDSVASLQLHASASDIKLWWPNEVNGHGAEIIRPLYNITATWRPADVDATSTTTRRLGFRTFALVTANDTDAAYVFGFMPGVGGCIACKSSHDGAI